MQTGEWNVKIVMFEPARASLTMVEKRAAGKKAGSNQPPNAVWPILPSWKPPAAASVIPG